MTAIGNGGIYAPLRQKLSDTESEDDCNKNYDQITKRTDSCNNLDMNSGLQTSSNNNYSMSDTEDMNTDLINTVMESTMDNVSFLQSDASSKMSFPRQCAFISSIVLCVFTVFAFLFGLPCSEVGNCSAAEWRDRTTSWELPYEEIELSGAVQVVTGAIPGSRNLVFIYRGNHMRVPAKNNEVVNGVVLIVGNSGKIGWYTRESRIPTEINCDMLDLNRDGLKECIVSGSEGFLAALNPLSGTYHWHVHQRNKRSTSISTIDFPILLKDLDKDKVDDLLTSATVFPNIEHNSLVVISGRTGNVIGEPVTIDDCLTIKLSEHDSNNISFICKNDTTEALRLMSFQVLYHRVMKVEPTPSKHQSSIHHNRRPNSTLKKRIGNTNDTYSNGKGKLVVENSGDCPDHCRVHLKLLLQRNLTSHVAWEYSADFVYAMKPSAFAFANSIHGFVLKL